MLSETKRQAWVNRLTRRVQELRDQIADAEVKAVLPPVTCSCPDLYIQAQHERAANLAKELTAVRLELADLTEEPADQLTFITV